MISLLIQMKKNFGCALIIVTHDISIGKMGDRKLYLKDGVLNEVV
ncbi:putative ABC transport system ATP-binding protein [Clostridium sp. DSM 8431]|nr:hypothetical protein [Clostridium sp. DSM 8431]SFU84756.1 putative ABC transport system ATP-binding protein [Clostridium sp. DSM 8431]